MTLWGRGTCSLVTQGLTQLLGVACGGGTLVQLAGLHLFFSSTTASLPYYTLLLSSQPSHVNQNSEESRNNFRNLQEDVSRRLYSNDCKNVSHDYIILGIC